MKEHLLKQQAQANMKAFRNVLIQDGKTNPVASNLTLQHLNYWEPLQTKDGNSSPEGGMVIKIDQSNKYI